VHVPSLLSAGIDHLNAGRHPEAAAAFVQVLTAEPGQAQALDLLRGLAKQFGRDDLVIPHLRAAWERQPERVDLLVEWAQRSLQSVSIVPIIEAFEDAARRYPHVAMLHERLGSLYDVHWRTEDALASYRRAIEVDPKLGVAHAGIAIVLYRQGKIEDALREGIVATNLEPDAPLANYCVGQILLRRGDLEAAHAWLRRAAQLNPRWDAPVASVVETLFRLGDFDAAEAAAVDASRRFPASAAIDAVRYYAHLAKGNNAAARELLEFERIGRIVMPPPEGYVDQEAFSRALAAELRENRSLVWEPLGKTTRGGHQTKNLTDEPTPAVLAFLMALKPQLDAYALTMPADHPLRNRQSPTFGIHLWATLLDSGGHQTPHIHTSGKISGVYYVELPTTLGRGEADDAGWIEFGRPPEELTLATEPPTWKVKPEEGLLVLFPSYAYHRTIPFAGGGQRISLAFDVTS
jgi:uncharacterized protein (TIGR02466 family)